MAELQVIIDRVGNTNVFNIIHGNQIHNPYLSDSESLQSITDVDLLEEYLEELNRIANISRSLSSLPNENEENQALVFQHLNLNAKLRQTGEAIFRQFFPEPLQAFIKQSENEYLFFHLDSKLASLPFEILHDGNSFLWEKFYLGKSIKGKATSSEEATPKENLNMLIIADPTEDLDWARKEGEALFEHLSSHFPDKRLNIELIGGRSITKLNLLNSIVNKDIVHFSGHLHYSNRPEENGWVLYNNKIIHSRELERSGSSPLLIFSNSCLSGRSQESGSRDANWYSNFASSFLKSGKSSYVGTNWELPDNEPTLRFTINFYDNLMKGKSIGMSLRRARFYARENFNLNDLTWASYLLMGNPKSKIFQAESKVPDLTQNILDYNIVYTSYPLPIAEKFNTFIQLTEKEDEFFNNAEKEKYQLEALFEVYENTVFYLSSIILANYEYLNMPNPLDFNYPSVSKILDVAFEALSKIKTLNIQLLIPNLLETMFIHKDNLYKIASWDELFKSKESKADKFESYIITVQYLLEGLLMDIEFIKNYGFYRIIEPGHRQLNLCGLRNEHRMKEIILPTQVNSETHEELIKKTSDLIGHCVFYNPIKKIFFDLSPYMSLQMHKSKNQSQEYFIQFKSSSMSHRIEKA